ncbi:MAG: DbpA RNA binding domain-containing protein, partial [Gammaproteobacteria bacterium]
MNTINNTPFQTELETQLPMICNSEDLSRQRAYVEELSARLDINLLDCAAALMVLLQRNTLSQKTAAEEPELFAIPDQRKPIPNTVRMVKYRLDIGRQHQVTAEELKRVLVEESGVDKKNIVNIEIQDSYTLIELPDEMPQDIFQHLKSVEINHHKLDIKRVKNRRAKRNNHRYGR